MQDINLEKQKISKIMIQIANFYLKKLTHATMVVRVSFLFWVILWA